MIKVKYKFLLFFALALLFMGAIVVTQRSARANAPLPTTDVYETPANFQRVLDAGERAPEVWDSLTEAEQDEILAVVAPDLLAQGKRPRLVGASTSNIIPSE